MEEIRIVFNEVERDEDMKAEEDDLIQNFNLEQAKLCHEYHKTIPGYLPTPLRNLSALAQKLNVSNIWVKDESKRFNLNAFKFLGASFSFAQYILAEANSDNPAYSFDEVVSKVSEETLLVTATDGNHGYGVAYIAKLFKCKAKILMPQGTVPARAERIRALGATCHVLDVNYDTCVEKARDLAAEENGLYIQDTALETDSEKEKQTALAIMQGYMTILTEFSQQVEDQKSPTHVFLQAGVGSFSGSLSAYLQNLYPENPPIIIIVEPKGADCVWRSAKAGDGEMRIVSGDMETIMAGLCCGVPSIQGWPILRRTASAFLSCEDAVTSRGMRILFSPLHGDEKIVSGESGAVCIGALYSLLTQNRYNDIRDLLNLDQNSRILCISTEGDTDPEGFFDSIWA